MTFENYVLYLQGTVENYSTKIKKHIQKQFVEAGIAQAQRQMTIETGDNSVDVIDLELEEQIKTCLKESKEAVKQFESWEFTKDYKYSTVFEASDFDAFCTKASEINCIVEPDSFENTLLEDQLMSPTKYEVENLLFIKFGLKYSAIHSVSGQEILLKYPVLIVCHKTEKFIEFRFDALKRLFLSEKKEQTVYSDLIRDLLLYCENELGHELKPIDLNYMISETKDKDNSDVRLMAQYMKLPRGGNAQLEVGKNEEYILPIIGDLKELLQKHLVDLEKVPELKEALDQFLFENDELSDYSWIEVMWENEIKTRSIRVKFIFEYRNNDYCLLQHYYNNVLIGMERMNHVIRYIAEHRPSQ